MKLQHLNGAFAAAFRQRRSHGDYWQLSPKVIGGILVFVALGTGLVSEVRNSDGNQAVFELMLYAAAGAIWLVDLRHAVAARWLAVALCLLLLAVGAMSAWGPVLWMMLFVPVLFAMLLLGMEAALLAASAGTLLYIVALWWDTAAAGVDPLLVLPTLWVSASLLVLFAARVQRLLDRWDAILQRAHAEVEETRDRKQEREAMLAELTAANRNLHLLNERVNAMRILAEEAHQAKAAFVANISHEFRTPLNMIIGMADTLTHKPEVYGESIPSGLRQDLEIVRRNARHLADMVNDVLDMSQSETGQLRLRREWGDLGTDMRKAAEVVQPLLDKKKLYLELAIADDLPKVYYDRARIRQVLLNLLSNAARYTDTGGISVQVAQEGGAAMVSVRDTGLGIPAEDLEKVFEPFYQAHNVGERSREGSGLGLNICRQIVTLHEGQIAVESKEGEGTTVTFRLPLDLPTVAVRTGTSQRWLDQDWVYLQRAQWPALPQVSHRQRVVVCDETGLLEQVYGSERAHTELLYVGDLQEAAGLLKAVPAHALLLNARSPELLLAQLEQAGQALDLPDLPLVGVAVAPPVPHDSLPGVRQFLTKPVQYAQLAQALHAGATPVHRVLVADDNVDAAQLFARMIKLVDETIETCVVHNGAEALAQMAVWKPDLVLLDLVMPQMDGKQFLAAKNCDPETCAIPVVTVSAEDPMLRGPASTLMAAALPRGFTEEALLQTACRLAALLVKSPAVLDREPG